MAFLMVTLPELASLSLQELDILSIKTFFD